MRPHDYFFYAAAGFVAGATAGGLGLLPAWALLAVFAAAAAWYVRLCPLAVGLAAVCFVAGGAYFAADDWAYRLALERALGRQYFEAVVADVPRRGLEHQTATVRTDSGERFYIRTDLYPELFYGDVLRLEGRIMPPPQDPYGRYMTKERIHGRLFSPSIEIVGNEADPFFEALFSIRYFIKNILARFFTQGQTAFLMGVMLGERDEFSREFLDKLSVSGTMHLTALSGLHMTIITFMTFAFFGALFAGRKRPAFLATFVLVALFVAMTGFKVSAIRASLMAFVVGIAEHSGRVYSPRNAIALAALMLTLWNPKSPVFDLGFQLSFAATLAIIYFAPVLKRLPFLREQGALGWRTVLAITAAARAGVAPIAVANFANFSFMALPANVLVLVVMPPLMLLGFLTVIAATLWMPLAVLLSKPTAFLVEYASAVIAAFAEVRLMFNPELGIAVAVLYYALLAFVCWRYAPQDTRPYGKSSR